LHSFIVLHGIFDEVLGLGEWSEELLDFGEVLVLDELHGLGAESALEVVLSEELVGGDDPDEDDNDDKISHF